MQTPKTVLITGCSQGLGKAMASEFARLGWTVIGCSRSEEKLAALRKSLGKPHLFLPCHVADDDAVAAFAKTVLQEVGAPDLLLNNAAIINPNARLWEVSAKAFDEVIDTNVKGTANVLRHFLPAILKRQHGVVVNFSSGWGRVTAPEVAPYCASKYAIEGLSQAVAQETGGKVAVIALNPGIIDTSMLRSCFGEEAGNYPSPEKWAKAAVPFLIRLNAKDNGKSLTAPE